ncbi:ABC transporter ATP-binding protein [Paracoccus sp. IB05]|uniref:ABC transporter ATP-binding protein n=1 Tax=Paracoccus sp. IB05 TaxID=2779367 RepID=UPI0018E736D3|nr:ABC transporter ATP-binding protein [Paracoccus sp. IB05]MBJ2153033.1 ABC transporter ATP-binding protein [Paracoccus sp. IB05]
MTAWLSIDALSKSFGQSIAVRDVSLEIGRGEFVTFLGPSGSGKSTLLYMIAGLETPSTGDIRLAGDSLLPVAPNLRNIGMVFQRYTLIPHLTVAENIAFPMKMRKWDRQRQKRRLEEMLALVRLEEFADRRPNALSGGQQQRVALARALAYEPEMLLMDEPLAALDQSLKLDLQREIRRIHDSTGATILYVTHDQEEAMRLSDRIAVFHNGTVEQFATPGEIYQKPGSAFVAGFVGHSNLLPAEMFDEAHPAVALAGGDSTGTPGLQPGKGAALFRPEDFTVLRSDTGTAALTAAQTGTITGTITDIVFLGPVVEILVRLASGARILVRQAPDLTADLRPGDQVSLRILRQPWILP